MAMLTDEVPRYKPPFVLGIFQFAILNNQMVNHPSWLIPEKDQQHAGSVQPQKWATEMA
jgi:hypothetical protein